MLPHFYLDYLTAHHKVVVQHSRLKNFVGIQIDGEKVSLIYLNNL